MSALRPVHVVLAEQGSVTTEQQAMAYVMEGLVLVNGLPVQNPRRLVGPDDSVALDQYLCTTVF
ncbi:S4 domain-containing protein [Rhodococcus sp. NPDC057529]|uniref:RNA-binding S4 domain-containing protein n=1 Tax=Rhodococcus sp. NPDC057529 TaxID=3346158 RepID=UPI003672974C